MTRFLCIASIFLFSTTVLASGELEINGSPLTLVLQDNNQAKVSSCADFISLRKSGETIKDISDISDQDFNLAKAMLTDCYISAYAIQNNLIETKRSAPSLKEILHHIPAIEKLIASNNEREIIKNKYKGKSIWDTSPDLMEQDNDLVSKDDDTGYRMMDYRTYTNKNGEQIDILILSEYTLHGTFGVRNSYIIKSKDNNIWDISKFDENSPL